MNIRLIQEADNAQVARIIRQVLTEFGANRPGFAWQDPELDAMFQAYSGQGKEYWVIESGGSVVGCGGIAEFVCALPQCCELQKMYLLPEVRNLGWGRQLIKRLLQRARDLNYHYCYLETLSSMTGAIHLYRSSGFLAQTQPLGASGHGACDEWYLKSLIDQEDYVES